MNGLQRVLIIGRLIVKQAEDFFFRSGPPSPSLAVAGCQHLQLPFNQSGASSRWDDWLTLAAPVKRTPAHRCRWNRRAKIPIPEDKYTQCLTCGGVKIREVLCPKCLKGILVETARKFKEISDQRKSSPPDIIAAELYTFRKLRPKYSTMIKHPVFAYRTKRQEIEKVLTRLTRHPLTRKALPNELYSNRRV